MDLERLHVTRQPNNENNAATIARVHDLIRAGNTLPSVSRSPDAVIITRAAIRIFRRQPLNELRYPDVPGQMRCRPTSMVLRQQRQFKREGQWVVLSP